MMRNPRKMANLRFLRDNAYTSRSCRSVRAAVNAAARAFCTARKTPSIPVSTKAPIRRTVFAVMVRRPTATASGASRT
jgi:hypothetical protein